MLKQKVSFRVEFVFKPLLKKGNSYSERTKLSEIVTKYLQKVSKKINNISKVIYIAITMYILRVLVRKASEVWENL